MLLGYHESKQPRAESQDWEPSYPRGQPHAIMRPGLTALLCRTLLTGMAEDIERGSGEVQSPKV